MKKILSFLTILTAFNANALTIDKSSVDLGDIKLGVPFAERRLVSFVIKNDQAGDANSLSLSLVEAANSDQDKMFKVLRNSCTGSLAAEAECSILIKAQPVIEGDNENPSYLTPAGALTANFSLTSSQGNISFSIASLVDNVVDLQKNYPIDIFRSEALDQKYSAKFKDNEQGRVEVICPAKDGDTDGINYCNSIGAEYQNKNCVDSQSNSLFPHKLCSLVLHAIPNESNKLFELKLSHPITENKMTVASLGADCENLSAENGSGYYLLDSGLQFCSIGGEGLIGFDSTGQDPNDLFTYISNRKPIIDTSADFRTLVAKERVLFSGLNAESNETSTGTVYSVDNDERVRLVGNWTTYNNSNGYSYSAQGTNNFFEYSFYGTGLNLVEVTVASGNYADYQITLNGSHVKTFLNSDGVSQDLLNGGNFRQLKVRNLVKGLPLGWHTVRVLALADGSGVNYLSLYGVEILNESLSYKKPKGKLIYGANNFHGSTEDVTLNVPSMQFGGKVVLAMNNGRLEQYTNEVNSYTNEELIINGTCDSATAGTQGNMVHWYNVSNAVGSSWINGSNQCFQNNNAGGDRDTRGFGQVIDTEIGKTYVIRLDKTGGDSNLDLFINGGDTSGSNGAKGGDYTFANLGAGVHIFTFVATDIKTTIHMESSSSTGWIVVDNISVKAVHGKYFMAADHSNEEVMKSYHWSDFGSGRSDDFSNLETTGDRNKVFTLSDGETILRGYQIRQFPTEDAYALINGAAYTEITFVGTGMDIIRRENSANPFVSTTMEVDGIPMGKVPWATGSTTDVQVKLVSDLPYGTHSIRFRRNNDSEELMIKDFIIYGPKKPILPASAEVIKEYNVVADYAMKPRYSFNEKFSISTGVIEKSAMRTVQYFGSWLNEGTNPFDESGYKLRKTGGTSGAAITDMGTGFELMLRNPGNVANISLYVDDVLITGDSVKIVGVGAAYNDATGIVTMQTNAYVTISVGGLAYGAHTFKFLDSSANELVLSRFGVITKIHSESFKNYKQGYNLPQSCNAYLQNDSSLMGQDGYYYIQSTSGTHPLRVYCDMTTDHGGWTLVQRMTDNDSTNQSYFTNGSYSSSDNGIAGYFKLTDTQINQIKTKDGSGRFRVTMDNYGGNVTSPAYFSASCGYDTTYLRASGACSQASTNVDGPFLQGQEMDHRQGLNSTNISGINGYWLIDSGNYDPNYIGNAGGAASVQMMWVR